MKLVRSYLLFTPLLYRILMLVVLPVAVWIFAIFFCVDAIIGTIMSAMIVCCVEIIADYWVFGGICTKEFPGLEFLKSSVRGRKIFPVRRHRGLRQKTDLESGSGGGTDDTDDFVWR